MPPNSQFPNISPQVNPGGAMPVAPQATVTGSAAPAGQPSRKNPSSTQNTLIFSEIRDDMVIMADGSFRAVVACKSINFDLMSNNEREAVEMSYQDFLNALSHPIQILVRSQRIDLGPYIDKLVEIRRSQDNMLLNVLMDDYINFIDILSQEANIMDKSFFIVIPYYPTGDAANLIKQSKGFFEKIFGKDKNVVTKIDSATYEKAKSEIKNRVDRVMAGLFQIGIQSVQLNTKELGSLYYNFYNPDTAIRQPLNDFTNYSTTFISKVPPEQPPAPAVGGGTF